MQYQQMIEAITESSRSCRGESCGVLLRGYCARKQQQRERQQQRPHQHLEPFGLNRICLSRRQEQERGAMGTFCETGRDAASADCKAQCGAVVFWDCRHFCLSCSLRVPLTPPSPSPSRSRSRSPSPSPSPSRSRSPSPSPSPSRSRSRQRSRSPSPSSRRRDLQMLVDLRQDLQIIVDVHKRPCQRSRSPSPSSRDLQILVDLRRDLQKIVDLQNRR